MSLSVIAFGAGQTALTGAPVGPTICQVAMPSLRVTVIKRGAGFPRWAGRGLAAGVCELNGGHAARRCCDGFDNGAVGLDLSIVPQPQQPAEIRPSGTTAVASVKIRPTRPRAKAAEMGEVEGVGEAVLGSIHAQRRQHDAVR
ncbi:MAG: hypothetical protein R3D67_01625 [Hyphomicrobiaceae bacterium]